MYGPKMAQVACEALRMSQLKGGETGELKPEEMACSPVHRRCRACMAWSPLFPGFASGIF